MRIISKIFKSEIMDIIISLLVFWSFYQELSWSNSLLAAALFYCVLGQFSRLNRDFSEIEKFLFLNRNLFVQISRTNTGVLKILQEIVEKLKNQQGQG